MTLKSRSLSIDPFVWPSAVMSLVPHHWTFVTVPMCIISRSQATCPKRVFSVGTSRSRELSAQCGEWSCVLWTCGSYDVVKGLDREMTWKSAMHFLFSLTTNLVQTTTRRAAQTEKQLSCQVSVRLSFHRDSQILANFKQLPDGQTLRFSQPRFAQSIVNCLVNVLTAPLLTQTDMFLFIK